MTAQRKKWGALAIQFWVPLACRQCEVPQRHGYRPTRKQPEEQGLLLPAMEDKPCPRFPLARCQWHTKNSTDPPAKLHRQPSQRWMPWIDDLPVARKPASTRPPPTVSLTTKPSSHRVGMNVVDCLQNGRLAKQIAIIPWPFLPEPKRRLPRPLPNRQLFEQPTRTTLQITLHEIRSRPFHGSQIAGNRRLSTQWQRQQVNMLRHEDECDQLHVESLASRSDGVSQILPPTIVRKQWPTEVAGKGELMQMPRLMKMFHEFPMTSHPGNLMPPLLKCQQIRWPFHPLRNWVPLACRQCEVPNGMATARPASSLKNKAACCLQ